LPASPESVRVDSGGAAAAAAPVPDASAHRRVARNFLFNAGGYVLTVGVAFLIAPLQVHKLGNAAYGIWVVMQNLISYSILMDFGMRYAVQREAARIYALHQSEELNGMLSTAALLACIPAAVALLAGGGAALFYPHWFTAPPGLMTPTRVALAFTAVAVALAFPGVVFNSVLAALSRYDILGVRNAAVLVAQALLLWYFLTHGYSLISVAAIYLGTVAAGQMLDAICAFRQIPQLRLRLRLVSRARARSFFRFSSYAFVVSIAVRLIYETDNLVVGWSLGAAAVAFYAVAGGLVGYARDWMSTVTRLYNPIAARMDALGEGEGLRELFVSGTRVGMLLVLPACFGLWAAGRAFLSLWMGPAFALNSGPALMWLTVTALICPFSGTYMPIFYATNRHRISAWMALGEAVANLALSLLLVRRWGIVGVAVGSVIPALINQLVLQPAYAMRLLGVGPLRFYGQALLRPLALAVVPTAGLAALATSGHLQTWPTWLAGCVAATLVYGGLVWALGLEARERQLVAQSWSKLRSMGAMLARRTGTAEEK
jgi:O-antigen/teichoic acid export membrane protein